ncbi:hypothetical protein [Mucilaginibacter rubeus]|uniref:Uncharacterized protein n=1 Tax=Mucilaginibacter rubeus TaxID=2027860 RepID=A0A5C1I556_9SPHI|nr:hypothetical protein [Mucilaginibacter rubeus]QEM12996.1 hypothetical protein DEO27_024285 [Mucilaginibacter rubeus]
MYHAGSIIYFPIFYFKNGAKSKAKYFLALKEMEADLLLVSLPSSIDHLPRFIEQVHGCLEIPEGNICCYIFKAGQAICENAWSFERDTYLYGEYLDQYEISLLNDIYPTENIDFEIIGTLTEKELTAVTVCFANSASVKQKYKRLLIK